MLVKLGLCNYGDYNNVTPTDDNYIKTNIKYSTFKKKNASNMLLKNVL